MSAFAGLGIDNAYVDLSAAEVPIMDGSAGPFVFLLQSAGIEEQNAPKRFVRIKQPVEVQDGDKWARFDPFDGFKVEFRRSSSTTRCSSSATAARDDGLLDDLVPQGSQPRAHVRLHARPRRRCARRTSRSAARWTTRSCSTTTAS